MPQAASARRRPKHCPSFRYEHATYEAALEEAEALMAMGNVEPGCHQTPYVCRMCGAWHVTNKRITFKCDVDVVAKA